MTTAADTPYIIGVFVFMLFYMFSCIWYAVRLNKRELALGVKREPLTFFVLLSSCADVLCKTIVFTATTIFLVYQFSEHIVACYIIAIVDAVLVWVSVVPYWRVIFTVKPKA